MPDWSSNHEIVKDMTALQKFYLAILGLVTWEMIIQLPSDWSIITRKREVHWPSFFYFCCKYSLWSSLIVANIATNVTNKVNCQALNGFGQFVGNTAIGSASTLLMLRTIAVWNRSPAVTVPLVLASLGQWAILFHGIVTVRSSWSDVAHRCMLNHVPRAFMGLMYMYTMLFDFLVLMLTTIRLVTTPGRSSLWQLLFQQGVVYFLVAFVANLLPTIFLLLNLNPIMNIIFNVAAVVASSIVACRSFVSLANFRQTDVYVHSAVPHSARLGSPGSGDVLESRAGIGRLAKNNRGTTDNIAGSAFRSMDAGVGSMGQACGMCELGTGTISSFAGTNSKRVCDFEGISENGSVVVHDFDGVMMGHRMDDVDLETAESLGHGHGHTSIVSRV